MNKKNVALIGIGYWGKKLKNYIPEYFNLKYEADSKFDLKKIWKDKTVENVIIATPIETHYELTKEALENNKNVFVEKPITIDFKQGVELIEIANKKNLKLGVDYTETFAPSRIQMRELCMKLGGIIYIEGSVKHLGRFMNQNVFRLLASHQLSMLSLIFKLDMFFFKKEEYLGHNNYTTTGSLYFIDRFFSTIKGRINVSINYPGREMKMIIYGLKGTVIFDANEKETLKLTLYDKKEKALDYELIKDEKVFEYDEKNNLQYSIKYFNDLIDGNVHSNANLALEITRIIEHA